MVFIIGLILGAAIVLFIVQNIMSITVTFLNIQFHGQLAVILLLAVLAGALLSALLSLPDLISSERSASKWKSHAKKLETDLDVHKQLLVETQARADAQPTVIEKQTTIIHTTDTPQ